MISLIALGGGFMGILKLDSDVSLFVGGFASGLDHPEGLCWAPDGFVYAGGESGQIYQIDVDKREFEQIASITGRFVGGLAADGNSNIYACTGGDDGVGIMKISNTGKVSTYSIGSNDEPIAGPNYPVFDSHGNLYVSDSGGWKEDTGKIYKIPPGGDGIVWDRSLNTFPNGLAISIDGEYLYVVMSLNSPRISRIPIHSDGSPGRSETVVELPKTVPDGIAFDVLGNLYISCYRPDVVYVFSKDGNLDVLAEDFEGTIMAAPTNIAFCGENLDLLLGANLGRWHLTHYNVDAKGSLLNYPLL